MKKNEEKKTIEVSIDEWNEAKADTMALKLQLRDLTHELEAKDTELAETKKNLAEMVEAVRDVRGQLHTALQNRMEAEKTAEMCVGTLTRHLMRWLTKENQAHATQMLKFYFPQDKIRMIDALLSYLIFGKRQRFDREVEKTHFKLICERIDEDAVTLSSHSLMTKLMQKYGLFESLDSQR